jgi:nucleotide-binding universal stress UspA family protein
MKKMIAAFDGLKFSNSTMEYAVHLTQNNNMHLVGIFLNDMTYHSYKFSEVLDTHGAIVEKRKNTLDQKDKDIRKQAENSFEKYCQELGLNYSIHHNRLIAIQELLHESIYSDLLLIDANETFSRYEKEPPTHFIQDLLAGVHCPVLLVPKKYKPIEKIILLYDGEPSSVYAIKMFSYVLDSLKHLPIEVLSVKSRNQSSHVPDNTLMKEFMKRHFPNVEYTVLKGEAESEIISYFKAQHENILTVLGAYRRGMISQWIRESLADVLMKQFKIPLFVAHES